jgi:hypothetical protein
MRKSICNYADERIIMESNDFTNIFEKACLIQLSTSVWQGNCKLEESVIRRIGDHSEWLKGSKDLVNQELLGPVRKVASQARNEIRKYSLPFPLNSIYLISKEALAQIDEKLSEYKEQFYDRVQDFELLFEMAKEEAKGYLGDLYNEGNYPIDITRKFRFEWRFMILDVPGKSMLLSPEIYEREKEKFQSMMEETRELAISALREEFGQIINRLTEKLNKDSTQPKVIKSSMFNKMREFLDVLGTKNIFEDDVLVDLSEQARAVIDGVSPEGIKKNDVMLQKIKNEMDELKYSIDNAIEDMPRRKIRMAS